MMNSLLILLVADLTPENLVNDLRLALRSS